MSNLPTNEDEFAETDALYRRLSAEDPGRPDGKVRQAVLEHATLLTRRSQVRATDEYVYSWDRPRRAWRRPSAFGALAASLLAVIIFGPRFGAHPMPARSVPAAYERPVSETPVYADIGNSKPMPMPMQAPASVAPEAVPQPAPPRERHGDAPANAVAAAAASAGAGAPSRAEATDATQAIGGMSASRAMGAPAPMAAAAPAAKTSGVNVPTQSAAAAADYGPALRRAAEDADLPALRELHDKRVNLDSRDAQGRTALMLATLHGHSQAVSALLAYGADPNLADASGETPLDAALAADESEIIAELKHNGAR